MYTQLMRIKKPGLTDLEVARLKGPVAKVMTVTHRPKVNGDLIEEGPVVEDRAPFDNLNHILTFGKDGYLTHELLYGKPGEWEENTYVGEGLVKERRQFKKGKLIQTSKQKYNKDGKLTSSVIIKADGTTSSRSSHTYNKDGLMLTYTHEYLPNPAHSKVTIYKYDEQGRQTGSERRKMESDELLSRTTKTYDEKGLVKETLHENFENDKDDFNYREVHIYNQYDDQTGSDRYDLKGNLIKTFRYGEHYEYDADGKRIMPERSLDDGPLTFQDKEDEHGNWVWRLALEDDVPRFVIIRQIQYHGEPEPDWPQHPLSHFEVPEDEEHRKLPDSSRSMPEFGEEELQFMYAQPNITPEHFPLQRYYASRFKFPPSLVTYNNHIEANAVLRDCLKHYFARKLFSYTSRNNGWSTDVRYTLDFPIYPGYVLHAMHLHDVNEDSFIVPDKVGHMLDGLQVSAFQFFCPPDGSQLKAPYFEQDINELMDSMSMKKRPGKPKINLIEVRNQSFTLVERLVHDNFTIRDLDINYGHSFEQFHKDLMSRFNSSSKGLVLFHGQPGTGKTYYIRHLLRQIALARKSVIYIPPNMVDHLTDPAFMTFLTTSVQNLSRNGQSCVLLIEDAEPLLAKRVEGVRIQGVTNLLNMTDGLLNDMLNLQIICTFNVDLRKLDSALLRPGRLLARKEFKPLSVLDANILAQRLGIQHNFAEPASLGEIYALLHDKNTLVHDVEPDKDTSNPLDDLL